MRIWMLFIMFSFVALLSIATVEAQTDFYVDDDFTKSGYYDNIQDAIDNASAGDIIHVNAGYYPGNLLVNESVKIVGNGTEHTFINGTDSVDVVHVVSDHVVIQNLSIFDPGEDFACILVEAHEATIDTCNLSDDDSRVAAGVSLDYSDDTIVRNCHYKDLEYGVIVYESNYALVEDCSYPNNAYGVEITYSHNVTVSNCEFPDGDYSVVVGSDCREIVIDNNTITSQEENALVMYDGANNCTLDNNTVLDSNNDGFFLMQIENITIKFNDIRSAHNE